MLVTTAARGDHVLLVHGLGRSARSMQPLESRLSDAGFVVHNISYPSREETPAQLIEHLGAAVDACRSSTNEPVHFVTHSLGGILVRAYLADRRPHALGRVVQLAPPNHGSELVDQLGDFAKWLGPTGSQLGTGPKSLPNRLGLPDYEIGVIAGNGSISLMSTMIPGPDDGKVSVESAQLTGAKDFLVVDATHTFIMRREDVALQIGHFLETGRFVRNADTSQ